MGSEPVEAAGPGQQSAAGEWAADERPVAERGEPGVTAREQSAPDGTVSEATASERSVPEAFEPDTTEPEATEPEATEPEATAVDAVRAAERRRRLAEVFGDVLPESTRDDRPAGAPPTSTDDRWYTENRPPHHGG